VHDRKICISKLFTLDHALPLVKLLDKRQVLLQGQGRASVSVESAQLLTAH
jgi:hypothetical protein